MKTYDDQMPRKLFSPIKYFHINPKRLITDRSNAILVFCFSILVSVSVLFSPLYVQLIFILVKTFLEGLQNVLYVTYFSAFISFFAVSILVLGSVFWLYQCTGCNVGWFQWTCFSYFWDNYFFFVVAIPSARCGNYISPFLCANSIWKSFLKYEWCPWNCKLEFHGHHSYFRKDFKMLLTFKEGHT